MTLRRVFDYALTAPIDELAFIDEARRLNMAAAELALGGEYGHSLGRTLRGRRELHVMGDSLFSRMLAYTSCRVRRPYGGCDGAGDEQLRQRQSGDRGHGAGGRLRSADGRFGGADAPCAGAEPPDGDLYQTELGAALGAVRLRRGGYGVELAASPT